MQFLKSYYLYFEIHGSSICDLSPVSGFGILQETHSPWISNRVQGVPEINQKQTARRGNNNEKLVNWSVNLED